MATYREIQNKVREQSSFVPKTCWIAHVFVGLRLDHEASSEQDQQDSTQISVSRQQKTSHRLGIARTQPDLTVVGVSSM